MLNNLVSCFWCKSAFKREENRACLNSPERKQTRSAVGERQPMQRNRFCFDARDFCLNCTAKVRQYSKGRRMFFPKVWEEFPYALGG